MIQIKVLKVEPKFTKANKPYKALEVEAEGEMRKVNLWSNAPDFVNVKEGSILTADMVKDGNYWNLQFSELKPRGGPYNANKEASITKVMDKKEASIGKFQDSKELSIKMASTMRMAVDLAIAEKDDSTVLDTLEESIEKWRAYCWKHWDDPAENPIYPN